jgi:hypothetical protein
MSRVVIQWTVYDNIAFYNSEEFERVKKPPFELVLGLADGAGVDVWLGLGQESDYWQKINRPPSLVEVYLQRRRVKAKLAVQELAEVVDAHPSVKGWYLNEEIDDRNWLKSEARRILGLHLQQLRNTLTEVSPDMSVAISCFSSGYADPQVFGVFWDGLLKEVPFDVLFFQDGIGVNKLDLYTLPLYLGSLRDAVGPHGTELRVVVEVFEQTSRWDEPFKARPAGLERVLRQVELALEITGRAPVVFSILEYMSPLGGRESEELFQRYLAESEGARDVTFGTLSRK